VVATDLLRALAGLAVPPRCGICARACDWRELACERCLAALRGATPARRFVPGIDGVICGAPYEGVARQLVAALKYGPRPALARLAAATMARAVDRPLEGRVVIPIPAAPRRLRSRGFDPAEAIAASLARELELRLDPCLRRADARRQVGRSRRERLAHPPLVSCVAPPPRAILADDVFTTGATLAACARALREAGCEEVVALVFAFAVPGGRLGPTPWPIADRRVAFGESLQLDRRE
jgi:predicted amidophosphoribosyltransferase